MLETSRERTETITLTHNTLVLKKRIHFASRKQRFSFSQGPQNNTAGRLPGSAKSKAGGDGDCPGNARTRRKGKLLAEGQLCVCFGSNLFYVNRKFIGCTEGYPAWIESLHYRLQD